MKKCNKNNDKKNGGEKVVKFYCIRDKKRYKKNELPCEKGEKCDKEKFCSYLGTKLKYGGR